MRFARSVVICQGLILVAFGLAFCWRPQEIAILTGTLLMDANSIGLMRAWLGGLPLGLAAFLYWSLRDSERVSSALVMLLGGMAALALARLATALISGSAPIGYDLLLLAWWVLGAASAGLALHGLRERPAVTRQRPTHLPSEPPRPFRRGDGDEAGAREVMPFHRTDESVRSGT
ncbi:DUF4345 family protein [Stutzerimonas tarimensis]|uniref:DUF4345 family protein n=1 Tax=Stutzerimonas tarimensis TaxID=1507735 RepID=A0ABV7T772_9GAMM